MDYERASEKLRADKYGFTGGPEDNIDGLPWWLRADSVLWPTDRVVRMSVDDGPAIGLPSRAGAIMPPAWS